MGISPGKVRCVTVALLNLFLVPSLIFPLGEFGGICSAYQKLRLEALCGITFGR